MFAIGGGYLSINNKVSNFNIEKTDFKHPSIVMQDYNQIRIKYPTVGVIFLSRK